RDKWTLRKILTGERLPVVPILLSSDASKVWWTQELARDSACPSQRSQAKVQLTGRRDPAIAAALPWVDGVVRAVGAAGRRELVQPCGSSGDEQGCRIGEGTVKSKRNPNAVGSATVRSRRWRLALGGLLL